MRDLGQRALSVREWPALRALSWAGSARTCCARARARFRRRRHAKGRHEHARPLPAPAPAHRHASDVQGTPFLRSRGALRCLSGRLCRVSRTFRSAAPGSIAGGGYADLHVLDPCGGAPRELQTGVEERDPPAQSDSPRVLALEQGAAQRARDAAVPRGAAGRTRARPRGGTAAGSPYVIRGARVLRQPVAAVVASLCGRPDPGPAQRGTVDRTRANPRADRRVSRTSAVSAHRPESRQRVGVRGSDAAWRVDASRRQVRRRDSRARTPAWLGLRGLAAAARARFRIPVTGEGSPAERAASRAPATAVRCRAVRGYWSGGTYPAGISAPVPKKCFSICSASHLRARGSASDSRFSLTSMVWCLSHCAHASFDTFS